MTNPINLDLTNKTRAELLQLASLTEALKEKRKYSYLDFVYPDSGPYSRSQYPHMMDFYEAGKKHRFRMLGGPNGSGKSFGLAVEFVYHITGLYPEWWNGKVQDEPRHWWIVAESAGTFKSSLQRLLIGDMNEEERGTGLIPRESIVDLKAYGGLSGACGTIILRHKKGHLVTVELKASEQKRENLQAANLDGVFFDEEPPLDIFTECLFRLRGSSTKPPGISILGFTPLKGLSDVVLQYLPHGQYPLGGQHPIDPDKYIVHIDDIEKVAHLSEEDKRAYVNNCPPHERSARIHGIPTLGSGKIYPVAEEQVFIKPFEIPDFWPRAYALDFGWHCTCALWGAKDPITGTLYIYAEYYQGEQSAQIHSLNIKARGEWIKGLCDPSGGGRQADGRQLIDVYKRSHGLDLTPADNAIAAGIARNLDMIQSGRCKVFDNLENFKAEYRTYRYDQDRPNEPARNQKDHAMDTWKYLTSGFDRVAQTYDQANGYDDREDYNDLSNSRDNLTGY
jgi:phage terminase large subunit-like protein